MPAHLFYELSANLPSLKARIQTLSKLPPAFSSFRGAARRGAALGDTVSVSIKEWRKGVHLGGVLVRASLTNAHEKSGGGPFLVYAQAWVRSPVTLSTTWNIIKPRLFSLDFETSPGVRLPFAAHDKLCMAEHFNGLVSFCV